MGYIDFESLKTQARAVGVPVENVSNKQNLIRTLCSDAHPNQLDHFLDHLETTAEGVTWLLDPFPTTNAVDEFELLFLTRMYTRTITQEPHKKAAQRLCNAIDHIIKNCTAEQLQKCLLEQITQGDFVGTTPCYWLMYALAWSAQKNPNNIQRIIPVIQQLFEKQGLYSSLIEITTMMSAKKQGNFSGTTPCYWLMRTLFLSAQKNPDNIQRITSVIEKLFIECNPVQRAQMMSTVITQGDFVGTTPCYWLMYALSFSAEKNPDNIQRITSVIEKLFTECSPAQRTQMMSTVGTQGNFAGTTPCYWLMNALAWSVQKNSDKIQHIIPVIKTLFENCDSTQLTTMISDQDRDGNNSMLLALRSLSSIQDKKIRRELAFVLFRLLGKLKTFPLDILSKLLDLKSNLSDLLKEFVKSHSNMDATYVNEFKSMCSPKTVLGQLIDKKTNSFEITEIRELVNNIIRELDKKMLNNEQQKAIQSTTAKLPDKNDNDNKNKPEPVETVTFKQSSHFQQNPQGEDPLDKIFGKPSESTKKQSESIPGSVPVPPTEEELFGPLSSSTSSKDPAIISGVLVEKEAAQKPQVQYAEEESPRLAQTNSQQSVTPLQKFSTFSTKESSTEKLGGLTVPKVPRHLLPNKEQEPNRENNEPQDKKREDPTLA